MIEVFRKYKNAFEMAVQTEEDEYSIAGWSDLVKQDTELLKAVTRMVDNKDNAEGRKIAVLYCKHKKESIRFLSDKVMKGEEFTVEDRSTIEL